MDPGFDRAEPGLSAPGMNDRLWLVEDAQLLIRSETLDKHPSETGGPLFGYEHQSAVVVTRVFGPGSQARHRPWMFEPDREAVQSAINRVARESRGAERYLGSWHSHPFGIARPSPLDRRTVRHVAADGDAGCPQPVILIQATLLRLSGARPGSLRAYQWKTPARRLSLLELFTYASPADADSIVPPAD